MCSKSNARLSACLAAFCFVGSLASAQNTFPSSGYVGIGTTSPSYALEILGGTQQEVRVTSVGSAGDPASTFRCMRARGTTSSLVAAANGDTIGQFIGTAFNGTSYLAACGFSFAVDGTVTSGNMPPGKILFQTTDSTGTAANRMVITSAGKVGVGTTSPDALLTVKGRVHATEVVVDTSIAANDLKIRPPAWADDVFDEGRALAPLSQVERQIKHDKHLPGIPSASDVAANGISVGDMQVRLLAKIEELTLRQIAQEKRIEALEQENAALRAQQSR
jgi:hypothetical protein